MTYPANTRTINKAIAHLGMEIVRGSGYAYFVSKEGDQIGESVMVTYLCHQSVDSWVEDAMREKERHETAEEVLLGRAGAFRTKIGDQDWRSIYEHHGLTIQKRNNNE